MFSVSTLLSLAQFVPDLFRVVDAVRTTVASGISFNSISTLFNGTVVHDFFSKIGGITFPDVHPDLQASAAISTTYAPDYVKKAQNQLNLLLKLEPLLDVDGHYGKMTQDATKKYQQTHSLIVDGWAGDQTMASMAAEVAKMTQEKKVVAAKDAVVPEMPAVAASGAAPK